ncbi:hypothetical protein E2I00_017481 [Balaenoptera physalus]|uniref:TOG domain-containing protein n=1 Tax=Balaenoptera physalus TaxID=9770 RepID=A0A643BR95_BALPH|nr:hypothetical protein E2I00_017481 [Balaenoptera physalus]
MEPAGLEQILRELLLPDTERIRRATEQLQIALRDPASLRALCELLASAGDPQVTLTTLHTHCAASVPLRRCLLCPNLAEALFAHLEVSLVATPWRQGHRIQGRVLEGDWGWGISPVCRHSVSLSLAQLSATVFRKEGLEAWPQLMQLLQHSIHSLHVPEREMGLLLLSVVVTSRPEAFQPHHRELLRLLNETLGDVGSPGLLFYSLRTLTTMAPYLGTDDVPLVRMLVPKLIVAVQILIPVDEAKACEALEALDELLESELPIITSHLSEVLTFCLEVARNVALGDAIRVRILCCLTFLVKVKSKALLKNRLLPPLLHTLFPIMAAEPPLGQLDPEDQDSEEEELDVELVGETPKHFAVQVVDMLALHLPPEKLCPLLMPMLEEALRSQSPYQRKAGLLVLAVLSDGAGDHIRQRLLSPLLQIVCRSLEDPSQVVRNAALFALGQFSENLQPHIRSYSGEVMPLLLAYLKSVPPGCTRHLAKACYALENFVENLGPEVQHYLTELMECMLQPLRNPSSSRAKELAASMLPYFPTIVEHLREFLLTGHEDLQPVRIQSLETLGVLARAVGEPMRPLAEECCQLGLGLYSLFAALSGLMGESLAPHLPRITTLMLLSLRSTEGIVPQYNGSSTFLLFDDERGGEEEEELAEEDEEEEDDSEISGRLCCAGGDLCECQTACQDTDQEEDEDQAEYDAMLLEHAGEAIPALATAAGGDAFAPFFAGFLPLLLCKTLLGLLLPLLARERHDRVHDNICGALARLLMASPTRKPEPQVLAALLHALPLKEDLEEWVTLGHLFSFLYQSSPDQVVDVAPELLRICSLILAENKVPPDTKASLLLLLKFLARQHADSFHSALGSLPGNKAQELQAILGLT